MGYVNAFGITSDLGNERERQEDYAYSQTFPDGAQLFLIADGCGSVEGFAQPERIVVHSICNELVDAFRRGPDLVTANWPFFVEECILHANRILGAFKCGSEKYAGFSCSLTCVLVHDKSAYVFHTGNTRLYLLRKGRIVQVTHDQTKAAERLYSGKMTEEQYHNDPESIVVTGGLSTAADPEIEKRELGIRAGDIYVMTTRGVHYRLKIEGIQSLVLQSDDCERAAWTLVAAAIESGSQNNATAMVIVPQFPVEENGASQATGAQEAH